MSDKIDISEDRKWFNEKRAAIAVTNLNKRRLNAQYVPNQQEALDVILGMIPEGVTVACGSSLTLDQLGITPELRKSNRNKVSHPTEKNEDGRYVITDKEQRFGMLREAFVSDVYLTGTNAVTLDGKLVNVDGVGNRVAAMIFGPKKLIVVVGVNKIVENVDEALAHIREVTAPMNAERHFREFKMLEWGNLPCVRTGRCADCRNEWRICNFTVIIEGVMAWDKDRINVVLIGEEMGF
jgi:hypothetical protein